MRHVFSIICFLINCYLIRIKILAALDILESKYLITFRQQIGGNLNFLFWAPSRLDSDRAVPVGDELRMNTDTVI